MGKRRTEGAVAGRRELGGSRRGGAESRQRDGFLPDNTASFYYQLVTLLGLSYVLVCGALWRGAEVHVGSVAMRWDGGALWERILMLVCRGLC